MLTILRANMKLKKFFPPLLLFCLAFFADLQAQEGNTTQVRNEKESVYRLNTKSNLLLCGGLAITDFYGHHLHSKKDPIPLAELNTLDQTSVNGFDRRVFDYSSSFRDKAVAASDVGMYGSAFLPLLLFADREIRRDWSDVIILFFKSELIGTNLYTWGGPMLQDRFRPITYFSEIPIEERMKNLNRNSFFSGHASTTATATFFVAKVYSDYHPELGTKKYLFFAAAALPPIAVAYYRMRALRHFPSDVILGTIVGSAAGILVPHYHKKRAQSPLSGSFFYDQKGGGIYLSYRF